jgi:hypothetical protein
MERWNIIFYLYLENEYIYLDEQYYEVINIVHVINENKIFFIIIDEVVKKEVPYADNQVFNK